MSDREQFLKTIIANPEDDIPRLVFADWLEEHGQTDRAEFIRLQCEMEHGQIDDVERHGLKSRIVELLALHDTAWKIPGIRRGVQVFRRGFVEGLQISAEEFIIHANRIGREAPVIELWLTAAESHTAALAMIPWLSRLRSLKFRADSIGSRLIDLFRPGLFSELRSLTILSDRIWSETVAVLMELQSSWPKLERLDLSGNPIGNEGFMCISMSNVIQGLEHLILKSDGIDHEDRIHAHGAEGFARLIPTNRLRTLNLSGQAISDSGFRALLTCGRLESLEHLDVSRNEIGNDGTDWAAILLTSPLASHLRSLNLSGNTVDPRSAEVLLNWSRSHPNCRIDLRACTMSVEAHGVFLSDARPNNLILDEVNE